MTKTEMFVRVKGTIINDMNDEDRLKELKVASTRLVQL